MLYIYTVIIIVFILILTTLFTLWKKKDLEMLEIKTNEAEDHMELLFETKLKILSDISKIVNKHTDVKALTKINKIKNKKLDIFTLDIELSSLNQELNELLEEKKYVFDKDEENLLKGLKDINLEIRAVKNYYNDKASLYNQKIHKISYLIIKTIKKYSDKDLFVFKKEVEFEILKNRDND